jgi:hypothetical protein
MRPVQSISTRPRPYPDWPPEASQAQRQNEIGKVSLCAPLQLHDSGCHARERAGAATLDCFAIGGIQMQFKVASESGR